MNAGIAKYTLCIIWLFWGLQTNVPIVIPIYWILLTKDSPIEVTLYLPVNMRVNTENSTDESEGSLPQIKLHEIHRIVSKLLMINQR